MESVSPFKFAFVPNKKHAKEEEKVGGVGRLEVQIEFGIHELNEVVEGKELGTHAGLVAEEVPFLE